jgi:hypothetical protein
MNMAPSNLVSWVISIFKAQGTDISVDWDQKISKLEGTSRFRTLKGTKTHNQADVMLTSSDSEAYR